RILREHHAGVGLPAQFAVADEATRLAAATELTGSDRDARKLLAAVPEDPDASQALRQHLAARDLVDFDSLVEIPAALLSENLALAAGLRARWPRVSVDEYQDIDPVQYTLLRAIAGAGGGLTAVGAPAQSTSGFRRADVRTPPRCAADFSGATTLKLSKNNQPPPASATPPLQASAPTTLVPAR